MNSGNINLRVIKMEYNIPTIQMDFRKTDGGSKGKQDKVNINMILAKIPSANKKHNPVPEAQVNVSIRF